MAIYVIALPDGVEGGTFTVSAGSETTGPISHDVTADELQEELRQLPGAEEVTVTGEPGGPYSIVNSDIQLTADGAELTGSVPDIPDVDPEPFEGVRTMSAPIPKNDFEALREVHVDLIRKALGGVILTAPMSAPVPDKLFASPDGTFADLKEMGYESLGLFSKSDGLTFPRETEQADVESFGFQEPTRSDITSDVTSATFRLQETNKQVLQLFHGLDLTDVVADENGEFHFDNPNSPETVYRRMIYIAKDGNGPNSKYIAKIMPRSTVTEKQEETWTSDAEISYGLTLKASNDTEAGFSVRNTFGGPGFASILDEMGFAA